MRKERRENLSRFLPSFFHTKTTILFWEGRVVKNKFIFLLVCFSGFEEIQIDLLAGSKSVSTTINFFGENYDEDKSINDAGCLCIVDF